MKTASFWRATPSGHFICDLCVRRCRLAPGETGFCGLRTAQTDGIRTAACERVAAVAVDPIEKKPLFHASPGAPILSFAIAGCNLDCPWCQNHDISQWPRRQGAPLPGRKMDPQDLVDMALQARCNWIAATYTEPTVFFEYALEVARRTRAAGLKNAWITNGTMMETPLRELLPFLDAANVDLKTCGDPQADQLLGVPSAHIQKIIEILVTAGVLVEITTLLVPGFNDEPWQVRNIAAFIGSLGDKGIWHVSRYHPSYRWTALPTPDSVLQMALEEARAAKIPYVYTGNMASGAQENTQCPACGKMLVRRVGFRVLENRMPPDGHCPACGRHIAGIWS